MKKQILATVLCSSVLLGVGLSIGGQDASAHGYVQSPISRSYQGHRDRLINHDSALAKYGPVIYEPQSLEALKGYPAAGPADGQIASASGAVGNNFNLDRQTSTMWTKQDLNTGPNTFTWRYTQSHSTTKWHYYITKADWNPNDQLDRSDFELLTTINHGGAQAATNPSHSVNIPNDRLGYHVVLAVWDVDDTAMAFYQVIDVNLKGDSAIPVAPTAPRNVRTTNVTSSTTQLTWDGQANASSFNIYRDGQLLGNTASPDFSDQNLTAETTYKYEIEAVGQTGLVSERTALSVTTLSETTEEKPTAPSHLHSMGQTSSSVSLMWGASTHSKGIKEYEILRDGQVIGSTTETVFEVEGLKAETQYSFVVRAISNEGDVSDESNTLTITTDRDENGGGDENGGDGGNGGGEVVTGRQWTVGSFFSPVSYTAGEEVVHNGVTYITWQSHLNYGDTNWAPGIAHSLFYPK
ncbi:lytic polysaccharide monooxygenase [Enterococcus mundtii]|uniref:Chitin-binding protein n=1 Tax=Enterococcus mundtii TaxID=53346 RepID=A0A242KW96_ENTMU|nr:lytic polysaccharide monooxygenase [Enterococcus mundtii]GEN17081.1 chitin-binding protein [Ligilactobacillus acidipiscis]AUB54247.1 carbohydrate-binding protein [Enterococcus mundtii]MZZ58873.1 carbohydrate-binding protein [Enterococcus mundtii]MZZ61804.1 carbohydrate-binding protein [Enterococcus mundtii]MZZ68952.1 carbohydrate-binding protein [Enterococcus mundtii]